MRELSHNIDPPTSAQAVATHTASGRRESHSAMVLAAVVGHPGHTAVELLEWIDDLGETEVRRRLTDLKNHGAVRQGIARRCEVRGSAMVEWWPTQKAERLSGLSKTQMKIAGW